MRAAIVAASVLALVDALAWFGIRAAERGPFSGWINVELVRDSVWGNCKLRVSVENNGRGTAETNCLSDEGKPNTHATENLALKEVEELRQLLRQASLFEGQSVGYDERGIDLPLITLTVNDEKRVATLVCFRNSSFESGPRKTLLAWLIDRMRRGEKGK